MTHDQILEYCKAARFYLSEDTIIRSLDLILPKNTVFYLQYDAERGDVTLESERVCNISAIISLKVIEELPPKLFTVTIPPMGNMPPKDYYTTLKSLAT